MRCFPRGTSAISGSVARNSSAAVQGVVELIACIYTLHLANDSAMICWIASCPNCFKSPCAAAASCIPSTASIKLISPLLTSTARASHLSRKISIAAGRLVSPTWSIAAAGLLIGLAQSVTWEFSVEPIQQCFPVLALDVGCVAEIPFIPPARLAGVGVILTERIDPRRGIADVFGRPLRVAPQHPFITPPLVLIEHLALIWRARVVAVDPFEVGELGFVALPNLFVLVHPIAEKVAADIPSDFVFFAKNTCELRTLR